VLGSDRHGGHHFDEAGVGEDHIDFAFLRRDRFIQAIQIVEIRDISLDGGDVLADFGDGFIQLGLTAAGDERGASVRAPRRPIWRATFRWSWRVWGFKPRTERRNRR